MPASAGDKRRKRSLFGWEFFQSFEETRREAPLLSRGRDFFGRRGFAVLFEQIGIFQKLRYDDAQAIAQTAVEAFLSMLRGGNVGKMLVQLADAP